VHELVTLHLKLRAAFLSQQCGDAGSIILQNDILYASAVFFHSFHQDTRLVLRLTSLVPTYGDFRF
jgi:hypothetical protein